MTKEAMRKVLQAREQREKGKNILQGLDECKNGTDVLDLLHKYMPETDIEERAKNVSRLPETRKLDATIAKMRMGFGTQRHQDIVNAAAQRYCELEGKNDTKDFIRATENDGKKKTQLQQLYVVKEAMIGR